MSELKINPEDMEFYNQAKTALGTDFIMFTNNEVENLKNYFELQIN